MEDKIGTKSSHSPSSEGSPSPSDAKDSSTNTIWVSTTTRIPIGDLFVPPLLTGV
jgi:hypothetical protein